jgi:sporulation protein YlmC with PRC-barrel domain
MARAPFALVLVEIGFGQPVVVGVPGMRALVVNGIDAIGALAVVVGQPLARRSFGVLSLHRRCSCKKVEPAAATAVPARRGNVACQRCVSVRHRRRRPIRRKDTTMTVTHTSVADTEHGRTAAGGESDGTEPQPRLMTASKMCGNKVINPQNETLGQIDQIVIDVPRGRIAYAAMASGGFLGLGERLFAVPWTTLVYDAGRECFVMDARKEVFENAPGFDKDSWPTQPHDGWHDEVHRYYGAPPYWM